MTKTMFAAVMLLSLVGTAGCGDLESVGQAVYVHYTPDGSLVVWAGDAIDVFDTQLKTRLARILMVRDRYMGGVFSLSDDGTVAAVASVGLTDNRVDLFEIPSGTRRASVELGPAPPLPPLDPEHPRTEYLAYGPEDLALSPHGDLVYVVGAVGDMYGGTGMFDVASGARLWTKEWAIDPIFSPDGSTLHVLGNHGETLQGFDARTGVQGLGADGAVSIDRLAMMPDAHTLIVLRATDCVPLPNGPCPLSIAFLSVTDGSTLRSFPLPPNSGLYGTSRLGMPAFRCSTSAGLCAVGLSTFDPKTYTYDDTFVQVWRTDGTLVGTIKIGPQKPDAPNDLAISPDGQFLALVQDAGVSVYRIGDGKRMGRREYGQVIF